MSKADWSLSWEVFPYLLSDWGIVASLPYKESPEKEAYFFYHNPGVPKRNSIAFVLAIYWSVL